MRAITPVFSVLLILILSVAIVGFFWLFVSGTFNSLEFKGSSTVNESLVTISSCMKIESAYGNLVSIRNCGKGSINQDTLSVYLDDIPLNVTMMSPAVVNQDEVGTVTLSGLWNFNLGGHTLRITNPRVIAEEPVNTVLPNSCVMDLEFDEGSGTNAYDSSPYGNNGILGNTTGSGCGGTACPTWVNSNFGKALQFDGIGDYVGVPFSNSLNITNAITVEAWVKFNTINQLYHQRIVQWTSSGSNTGGFSLEESSGKVNFWVYIGGTLYSPSAIPVQTGVWYNFVGTFNGTAVTLTVNGVKTSVAQSGTINSPTNPVIYIGKSWDNYTINGIIDNVRIYNQVLTPDQTISLRPVSYD